MSAKALSSDVLKKLSAPFDKKTIGIKVQALNSSKTAAMLVPYVQHTDAYARIEKVDECWSCEVTHVEQMRVPDRDREINQCFAVVALTILGVTRTNTGQGDDLKSATSDGIKRAAMLFGIGRYLYDAEPVWIEYSREQDYGRVYTYEDYEAARKRGQPVLPTGPESAPSASSSGPRVRSKQEVEDELFGLAKDLGWDSQRLFDEAEKFCDKSIDDISVADMERIVAMLQSLKTSQPARRGFGR